MTPVAQEDIVLVTEDVWLSILNMAPHVTPRRAAAGNGPTLAGIVQITGAWKGAVTVQVPAPLAERLAATMFMRRTGRPTAEEQIDALGEITNMIGGSVKGLIEGRCHLSLPAVIAGSGYEVRIPGGRTVNEVAFTCDGHGFVVSVVSVAA
ncbi:MAG: chemotaxis protein CheX [Vicinamibacterales bacterium]